MKSVLTFFLCVLWLSSSPAAVLSVGTWNVFNNPDNSVEDSHFVPVFSAIGTFAVMGINEGDTGSIPRLAAVANSALGVSSYASLSGTSRNSDRNGFVYDTAQVSLVSSAELTDATLTRIVVRALFSPVGSMGITDDFYVYAAHLKSGSGSADEAQRGLEAALIRADIDALPASSDFIVTGDLNTQSVFEPTFDVLLAAGSGQVYDPADALGAWNNNPSYLGVHTQNPRASIDDRFDFVLPGNSFSDGFGYDYLAGSYTTIGNNGTHTFDGAVTTGNGDPALLTALTNASDHLPVFATFTLSSAQFVVPEPGTVILVVLGAVSLSTCRRRGA